MKRTAKSFIQKGVKTFSGSFKGPTTLKVLSKRESNTKHKQNQTKALCCTKYSLKSFNEFQPLSYTSDYVRICKQPL